MASIHSILISTIMLLSQNGWTVYPPVFSANCDNSGNCTMQLIIDEAVVQSEDITGFGAEITYANTNLRDWLSGVSFSYRGGSKEPPSCFEAVEIANARHCRRR